MTVRQFLLGRWQTALAVAIMLAFVAPVNVHAQTYTVLHTFTGGVDGATPFAGLTWDGGSNFYGTASQGGYAGTTCYDLPGGTANGCGTVFQLHRSGSNWAFSTLYEFRGGTVDGNLPHRARHPGARRQPLWHDVGRRLQRQPSLSLDRGWCPDDRLWNRLQSQASHDRLQDSALQLDRDNKLGIPEEPMKAAAPVPAKASWFSIKPAIFTARIGIPILTLEKFFSLCLPVEAGCPERPTSLPMLQGPTAPSSHSMQSLWTRPATCTAHRSSAQKIRRIAAGQPPLTAVERFFS